MSNLLLFVDLSCQPPTPTGPTKFGSTSLLSQRTGTVPSSVEPAAQWWWWWVGVTVPGPLQGVGLIL